MDILSRGFVAGTVAGIIKNCLDLLSYHGPGFNMMRYLDHFSGAIYGHMGTGVAETIFALLLDIWFSGFLGVVFFLLANKLRDTNHLVRGWLYGSALWFIFHMSGSVLHVPSFTDMAWQTLFLHLLTDSIYGIVLGLLYRFLENNKTFFQKE